MRKTYIRKYVNLTDKRLVMPTIKKMKEEGWIFESLHRFRSNESESGYFIHIDFEPWDGKTEIVTKFPDVTEDEFGIYIFDVDKNKRLTLTEIPKNPIYYVGGKSHTPHK